MREMSIREIAEVGGAGIYTDANNAQFKGMVVGAVGGAMTGGVVGFCVGLVGGAILGMPSVKTMAK